MNVNASAGTQQFQSLNLCNPKRQPLVTSSNHQQALQIGDMATFSYKKNNNSAPRFGGLVKNAAKQLMDGAKTEVSDLKADIKNLQNKVNNPTEEEKLFVEQFRQYIEETLKPKLEAAEERYEARRQEWIDTPADE